MDPQITVPGNDVSSATMTPEACDVVCMETSSKYYGLTGGSSCLCTNADIALLISVDDILCNITCASNESLICGGEDGILSLYTATFNIPYPTLTVSPPTGTTETIYTVSMTPKVAGVVYSIQFGVDFQPKAFETEPADWTVEYPFPGLKIITLKSALSATSPDEEVSTDTDCVVLNIWYS